MSVQIETEYGAVSTNALSFWLPDAPVDLAVQDFSVTWNRAPDQWATNNDYANVVVTYELSVTDPSQNVMTSVSDLSVTTHQLTLSDYTLNVDYDVKIFAITTEKLTSVVSTIKFNYKKITDAKLDLVPDQTTSI